MIVEVWRDEHGIEWELVLLEGDSCIIRQGLDRTDWMDGDVREGVHVIARFSDPEDARGFLEEEGFGFVRVWES